MAEAVRIHPHVVHLPGRVGREHGELLGRAEHRPHPPSVSRSMARGFAFSTGIGISAGGPPGRIDAVEHVGEHPGHEHAPVGLDHHVVGQVLRLGHRVLGDRGLGRSRHDGVGHRAGWQVTRQPRRRRLGIAIGRDDGERGGGARVSQHPGHRLDPPRFGARGAARPGDALVELVAAGAIEQELPLGLAIGEPGQPTGAAGRRIAGSGERGGQREGGESRGHHAPCPGFRSHSTFTITHRPSTLASCR